MGAGGECDRYNRSLPLRIYGFGKTNPTETELRGESQENIEITFLEPQD